MELLKTGKITKMNTLKSPRITNLAWGSVKVEGVGAGYHDAKLFPGGSRAWEWTETGTHHSPGILPADITELLEHNARVIILSQGVLGRLGVAPETLETLRASGITVHVLKTKEAVRLYNQLCQHEAVGALIHSTC